MESIERNDLKPERGTLNRRLSRRVVCAVSNGR